MVWSWLSNMGDLSRQICLISFVWWARFEPSDQAELDHWICTIRTVWSVRSGPSNINVLSRQICLISSIQLDRSAPSDLRLCDLLIWVMWCWDLVAIARVLRIFQEWKLSLVDLELISYMLGYQKLSREHVEPRIVYLSACTFTSLLYCYGFWRVFSWFYACMNTKSGIKNTQKRWHGNIAI